LRLQANHSVRQGLQPANRHGDNPESLFRTVGRKSTEICDTREDLDLYAQAGLIPARRSLVPNFTPGQSTSKV